MIEQRSMAALKMSVCSATVCTTKANVYAMQMPVVILIASGRDISYCRFDALIFRQFRILLHKKANFIQ